MDCAMYVLLACQRSLMYDPGKDDGGYIDGTAGETHKGDGQDATTLSMPSQLFGYSGCSSSLHHHWLTQTETLCK